MLNLNPPSSIERAKSSKSLVVHITTDPFLSSAVESVIAIKKKVEIRAEL